MAMNDRLRVKGVKVGAQDLAWGGADDDIGAASPGERTDLLDKVDRPGVQDLGRAGGEHGGAALRRAGRADHHGAQGAGDLDTGQAHPAGRAVDEDGLARSRARAVHQRVVGGEEGAGGGAAGIRQPVRRPAHDALVQADGEVPGQRVAAAENDPVAGSVPADARSDPHHLGHALHAQVGAEVSTFQLLVRDHAEYLERVLVVQPGAPHAHLDLAWPRIGARLLAQRQVGQQRAFRHLHPERALGVLAGNGLVIDGQARGQPAGMGQHQAEAVPQRHLVGIVFQPRQFGVYLGR
jgi:hypothetical protein